MSDQQPDPVLMRLDATLGYYDRQASWSRFFFVVAKVTTVLVAASIPVLSGFGPQLLGSAKLVTLIVGVLGALIVVVEGLLRLLQWEQHWLRYRGTWLALYDEKKRAGSIG